MSAPDASVLHVRVTPVESSVRLTLRPVGLEYSVTQGDSRQGWASVESPIDYSDVIDLLDELEATPVGDRGLLPEVVALNGVSLWHFAPSFVLPEIFRALELAKAIDALVATHDPNRLEVTVPTDGLETLTRGAVEAVAKKRSLPVAIANEVFHETGGVRSKLGRTRVASLVRLLNNAAFDLGSARLGDLQRKPRGGDKRLLFVTYPRLWTERPDGGGSYDEQLSPLLPALVGSGWGVDGVDVNYASRRRLAIRTLLDRMRSEKRVHWSALPMARGRGSTRDARARLAALWNELFKDAEFRKAFRWKELDLWTAFVPILESLFSSAFPEVLRLLHLAEAVLDDRKPDAVAMSYETGPAQRALVVKAAERGIPTVGLQHGLILENHYEYIHERVTTAPDRDLAGYPAPTVTCVWGPAYAATLRNVSGYPAGAVVDTGHWRYSWLLPRLLSLDVTLCKVSLGLAPDRPVVAIFSSYQETQRYLLACADALRRVCTDDRGWEAQVIVKPHPSEPLEPIHSFVVGRAGWRLSTSANAVQILSSADVVISQPSTIVTEASLLDKPVVCVDLTGTIGGWNRLRDSNAVLYATDMHQIVQRLSDVRGDKSVRNRLAQGRAKLIADYFGDVHGDCARNVVDVLDRLEQRHE